MSAHEKSKSSFDLLMNRASDVFQALSHPLRLSICFELGNGEQSVSQLCNSLHQPQHSISQHLALLRKQSVVKARKQSRQVFYQINDPQVQKVLNCIKSEMAAVEPNGTTALSLAAGDVPQVAVASEAGRFSTVFKPSLDHWQRHDKG
ncbi:metalloregulator ArsR/SmtB family transcription factor [Alphaproteobacteria bacterium]|nr:metalloregulator ArsR/SmtB family transcription factor [Alphaproteobacteria bacterium]